MSCDYSTISTDSMIFLFRKGESYGLLYYLDRSMDKVSVKAPIPLKKCGGSFYSTTTLDDPIIKKVRSHLFNLSL